MDLFVVPTISFRLLYSPKLIPKEGSPPGFGIT
jgi:hypothetical protein